MGPMAISEHLGAVFKLGRFAVRRLLNGLRIVHDKRIYGSSEIPRRDFFYTINDHFIHFLLGL